MTDKYPHSLFFTTEVSKEYRLFLDDLIQNGSEIHNILNTLHDAGDGDSLEIRINSCGGYVKHGNQFINVIRDRFAGRAATVLESDAYSMAASVFMAADTRIIYPHSVLMVHEATVYHWGKVTEGQAYFESSAKAIRKMFESLFKGYMTKKEMKKLFEGKDYYFDDIQMCERGIATHVIYNQGLITAEEYLAKSEK